MRYFRKLSTGGGAKSSGPVITFSRGKAQAAHFNTDAAELLEYTTHVRLAENDKGDLAITKAARNDDDDTVFRVTYSKGGKNKGRGARLSGSIVSRDLFAGFVEPNGLRGMRLPVVDDGNGGWLGVRNGALKSPKPVYRKAKR